VDEYTNDISISSMQGTYAFHDELFF